jgi:hypothetical protein
MLPALLKPHPAAAENACFGLLLPARFGQNLS